MEKTIRFNFVSHYYENIHQFISRVIEFIKDYRELSYPKESEFYILNSKIDEFQNGIITLGEIIPSFIEHEIIKTTFGDFNDNNEIVSFIEKSILDTYKKNEGFSKKSIVIEINHLIPVNDD
jgi:hypothetical protein